jgi:hypothetical protein
VPNKLIETSPDHFTAQQPYNFYKNKKYHLTMVILFKKDKENYKAQINKNKADRTKLENQFSTKTGYFTK